MTLRRHSASVVHTDEKARSLLFVLFIAVVTGVVEAALVVIVVLAVHPITF